MIRLPRRAEATAPAESRAHRLILPRDGGFDLSGAEAALASLSPSLSHHRASFSLEWSFLDGEIRLLLGFPATPVAEIRSHLLLALPKVRLEAEDALPLGPVTALPLRLALSPALPIRVPSGKEADPLPSFLAAMAGRVPPCGLRLSLRPAPEGWKRRMAEAERAARGGEPHPPWGAGEILLSAFLRLGEALLSTSDGRGRTPASGGSAELIALKARGTLFAVRAALWSAGDPEASGAAVALLAGHLAAAFRDPGGNALRAAGRPALAPSPDAARAPEIPLSAAEAASLFHAPREDLPFLPRELSRSLPVPSSPPSRTPDGPGVPIGEAQGADGPRPLSLSREDLRRHLYVLGKTGTGKSTLLAGIARADIEAGRGFALIDPHGDLAERVMGWIPPSRFGETTYLDPADSGFPVGFDPFSLGEDRPLAASALIGAFRKLYGDSWGPRLEHFLRNALLALLETPSPSLLDLPRLFADREFRRRTLRSVRDPVVRSFFLDEFERYDPRFRAEAVSPILNKAGAFLSQPSVRRVVGQAGAPLRLRRLMDEGGILVANLASGRIGEDGSALLGGLLVAGFGLAALSRKDVPEEGRRDFRLVVDEFQRFAGDAFSAILPEARKFRLSLVLSHQHFSQLPPGVGEAVIGNAGALAAFRLGSTDAERIARELSPSFDARDLVHLPNFRFCFKATREGGAQAPFTAQTLPPPEEREIPPELLEASRRRWGRPRAAVDIEIADRLEDRFP